MSGWAKRNRSVLAIGLGTVAALVVAVLITGGPRTSADRDPENPGGTGAQAIAQVLEDQGVVVEVVRSAAGLEESTLDEDTTVIVTSPENLGQSTIDRLLVAARDSSTIVVWPAPGTVEALGIDAGATGGIPQGRQSSDCTDTGLGDLDGMSIEVDVAATYATTAGCFPTDTGWALASASDSLTLLGAAGIIENDQVLRADNAAVALRLLGQHPRVVWYVPSLDDLSAGDGVGLRTLLPRWLAPALWLTALTMVAVIWWRGRRLGRLAVEPLPVAVRSLETTESRGRLYRSASARAHAAQALRISTRDDLTAHLRVPAGDAEALVRDVASRVDRPIADVAALIGADATAPHTDDELIRLAESLAELDREVRRT